MTERIDLREGFRVEVYPMVIPSGSYGAQLYRPKVGASGRTTWKPIGMQVVSDESASGAAEDLLRAVNMGLMPRVDAADGLPVAQGESGA